MEEHGLLIYTKLARKLYRENIYTKILSLNSSGIQEAHLSLWKGTQLRQIRH